MKRSNEEVEILDIDDIDIPTQVIKKEELEEVEVLEKKSKKTKKEKPKKEKKVKKEKVVKEKKPKKEKKVKKEKVEIISDEEKPKKTRVSKKKIIIVLIIFALMLCGIGGSIYTINNIRNKKKDNKKVIKVEEEFEPVLEEKEETTSFSMIAFGDALIHSGVYADANTYQSDGKGYYKYDFHKMFTYVGEAIKGYDLKFYNQETVIGGKNLGLSNYPCFNSPDEIGNDLVDIGFNVVNLASNHTVDKGVTGATYSANFWQSKEDVLAVGSYRSADERNSIEIREVNGITYAMLSYTYGTNGIPVYSGYEYLVNVWTVEDYNAYQNYKNQVKRDVEAVRDKVDILMVSMHWGIEYQLGSTNWYQQDSAKYLADLGVDVIIGTHPHVVQPIEFIGDTLVIYSLGNMISAQAVDTGYPGYRRYQKLVGGVAAFTVTKTTNGGEVTDISISDVKADLVFTYYNYYQNFKIYPFTKLNDSLLYDYRGVYNYYKQFLNPKGDSRIQVGFLE